MKKILVLLACVFLVGIAYAEVMEEVTTEVSTEVSTEESGDAVVEDERPQRLQTLGKSFSSDRYEIRKVGSDLRAECEYVKDIDGQDRNFYFKAHQWCTKNNPRSIYCRNDCRRDATSRWNVARNRQLKEETTAPGAYYSKECKLVQEADLEPKGCAISLSKVCAEKNPSERACQSVCRRKGYDTCSKLTRAAGSKYTASQRFISNFLSPSYDQRRTRPFDQA